MDDTISRAKVIDALDEIEAEVAEGFGFEYEKWLKYFCDLPPAQLGTNLAEVGTDCISREQAIEALDKRFDSIPMEQTSEILMLRKDLRELPPAQPEPDQNGDLWITVPDIDKVTRIYVQESKSKFCRIFYEER